MSNAFDFYWEQETISERDINRLLHSNRIFNECYSKNIFGFNEFAVRKFKNYFSRNNDVLLSLCMNYRDDSLIVGALNNQLAFKNSLLRSTNIQQYNPNFNGIKNKLNSDEIFIDFVQFSYLEKGRGTRKKLYAAFIVNPFDEVPRFVVLFNEEELISALTRNGKLRKSTDLYLNSGLYNKSSFGSKQNELSKLVWNKLAPFIPKDIHKIYYLPDGILGYICMSALTDERGFLIDNYEFRTLLDASSLSEKHFVFPFKSTALFGGIKYGTQGQSEQTVFSKDMFEEQYEEMLQTTKSIDSIIKNRKVNTELYADTNATEEAFSMLQKKKLDLLFVFTHGFSHGFDSISSQRSFIYTSPNGMDRCGLALANANASVMRNKVSSPTDGLLTGTEIEAMDLTSVKLVVLGACQTGVGEIEIGEGIWGLQRVFKIAGVKYILASTCTVETGYSSEFLTSFFLELSNNTNYDIETAFINTQKMLKNKHINNADWSSWILMK